MELHNYTVCKDFVQLTTGWGRGSRVWAKRQRKSLENCHQESRNLGLIVVWVSTTCMWLFWAFVYMHQETQTAFSPRNTRVYGGFWRGACKIIFIVYNDYMLSCWWSMLFTLHFKLGSQAFNAGSRRIQNACLYVILQVCPIISFWRKACVGIQQ